MADIKHDLSIAAPVAKVFAAVSEPAFLDEWWTETCRGTVATDAEYELGFGPEYQWRARVSIFEPEREFELTITDATDDWIGTKVGFVVVEEGSGTHLQFRHTGWSETSGHFRHSSFCWALYLRILRRYLEKGNRVPYTERYED